MFFNDGEYFEGYGSIKNNKIKFRLSLDDEAEKWDYESISKIEFETFFEIKTYEYIRLNKESNPVLLQLISKGEVSLYREVKSQWRFGINSPNNNFLNNNFRNINFPNKNKITTVTNFMIREGEEYPSCLNCGFFNKWKKRTIDFLIDCPELIKKIKSNEFGESDLQEIINYYNDFCSDL